MYCGPWLYFSEADYRAPVLPDGGLAARDALALYLACAPAQLHCRQAAYPFATMPSAPLPIWQRRVAAWPVNCARHADGFEKWQNV